MKSPHISIRIPPQLNMQLEAYIKRNGVTKTEVMVSALARYLDCDAEVPLNLRIRELEERVKGLETVVYSN